MLQMRATEFSFFSSYSRPLRRSSPSFSSAFLALLRRRRRRRRRSRRLPPFQRLSALGVSDRH